MSTARDQEKWFFFYSALFRTTSRLLCPVWGPPVQETFWLTGTSSAESQDAQRAGALTLWQEAEGVGLVHSAIWNVQTGYKEYLWGQSPLEQEPRETMQSMFGGCKEVVKIWLAKLGLTCSIEQLGVILELVLLSAGDWTRWCTNAPSNLWYLTILCVCIKYKSMENQNVS